MNRAIPWARQAAGLALCAATLAAAANVWGPRRIPWRGDWEHFLEEQARRAGIALIGLTDARDALERKEAIFFDARPAADFAAGHLPGAFSWTAAAAVARAPEFLPLLMSDPSVVVYCAGLDCDEALLLAVFLKNAGVKSLWLMAEGIAGWRRMKFPEARE